MFRFLSMRSSEHLLPLVVVTQLAILAYLSLPTQGVALLGRSSAEESPPPEVNWSGKALPAVSVGMLDGRLWDPTTVQARPTVLVVLDQCGRCGVPYLKEWDEFVRRYSGVDVIIASGEQPTKVKEVLRQEFRRGTRLQFACYTGSRALSRWGIGAMPRVFVLGRGGVVRFARPGLYDPKGAMAMLERQLADQSEKLRGAPRAARA
jgi:hypothetical protein